MKKVVCVLLLVLSCQMVCAQSAKILFREFKGKPKVEYLHCGKMFLTLLRPFIGKDDPEVRRMMHCVKSVKMMNMEDCDAALKAEFMAAVRRLNTHDYLEVVGENDGDERSRVMIKMKKNVIREILLFDAGKEDCSFLLIRGKVSPEDLAGLIKEGKKKKN